MLRRTQGSGASDCLRQSRGCELWQRFLTLYLSLDSVRTQAVHCGLNQRLLFENVETDDRFPIFVESEFSSLSFNDTTNTIVSSLFSQSECLC